MNYCNKCVQPDTRPGVKFNEEGTCFACVYAAELPRVDWGARQKELLKIAESIKHDNHSGYDCIIGVSGGKDSLRQAMYARDVLRLKPLLVCCSYPPEQLTKRGAHNMANLISLGFDTITVSPDPKVWKKLMRDSFLKYGNWAKPTETALYATMPKVGIAYHIPLAFLGENPATHLGDLDTGSLDWNANKMRNSNTISEGSRIYLGDGITGQHLFWYEYPRDEEMQWANIQVVYLGYFVPDFNKVANGEFAMHYGLEVRTDTPQERGALHSYEALDDDFVVVNQMIKYFKFGFGKVTDEVCEDIRFGRMSRQEGFELVKKYDGKCSPEYIRRFCDYIDISEEKFWEVAESYRNKDLFEKIEGKWKLKSSYA